MTGDLYFLANIWAHAHSINSNSTIHLVVTSDKANVFNHHLCHTNKLVNCGGAFLKHLFI